MTLRVPRSGLVNGYASLEVWMKLLTSAISAALEQSNTLNINAAVGNPNQTIR